MRGTFHLNSSRLTSLHSRILSDQTRLILPLTFTAFPFFQALFTRSFSLLRFHSSAFSWPPVTPTL